MRTAACVVLIVSLVGPHSAALLSRGAVPAGQDESALSHHGQPPMLRAQTSTRLLSPRFCSVRAEACELPDRHFAQLAASLAQQANASALAARPDFVLRI